MNNEISSSSCGLDTVNISFLPKCNRELPLVISPRWDNSLQFLTNWCKVNRKWVDAMLLKYGAILIRGFEMNSPSEMEQVIMAYQPKLNDTYRGTSPRRLMEGTHYMFSAAEVPTNYPIAQHIEMSFLDAPPKQLYFGCVKPSTTAGGETALADFRKVYQDLPIELKEKFLQKGIRYTRTHKRVGSYYTFDVSDMLGWPELFGTANKQEVERICAEEGIPMKWDGPNMDVFVSETQSHAFQIHPITKELVWFNHTQVFHWTTFPAELFFAFKRTWDFRLLLHCTMLTIFCVIKYGILGHKMSLDSTFDDGEAISYKEMSQIRNTIHKNMVFNRWEKGDLVLIDNFSTSHGRQPTYDSGRKVVVAWSDPIRKSNKVTTLYPILKNDDIVVEEEEQPLEGCQENPQERTPESTLTKAEGNTLKRELFNASLAELLKQYSESNQSSIGRRGVLHKRNRSEPILFGDSSFWQMDD